ncbi:hypothetical protein ACWD5R_45610 [Streptomyces sp. NPDC002514]
MTRMGTGGEPWTIAPVGHPVTRRGGGGPHVRYVLDENPMSS